MIQIRASAYKGTKEQPLEIGRLGEKFVRTVVFDIDDLRASLGNGSWDVVVERPFEKTSYLVEEKWESEEGYACWDISDTDTGIAGFGRVELRYYPDTVNRSIYKSRIWITHIDVSLGQVTTRPDPYNDVIDKVVAARDSAIESAEEAFEYSRIASQKASDSADILADFDEHVGKATITLTENGSSIGSFNINQQENQTINITIPDSVLRTEKGSAGGVAELDSNGFVPSSQLPSYVDDILEYSTISGFPVVGETGKIYVDTSTNLTYRWSGSTYVEISKSLALGITSSTAFRGDYGKIAYDYAVGPHLTINVSRGALVIDNS